MQKFRPGQQVQLITGGPVMTVNRYELDDNHPTPSLDAHQSKNVRVLWFEGGKQCKAIYSEDLLREAPSVKT